LYLADSSLSPWQKKDKWSELQATTQGAYLDVRDRAEDIFKERAEKQADERCLRAERICKEATKARETQAEDRVKRAEGSGAQARDGRIA